MCVNIMCVYLQLIEGDFLSDEYKATIETSTVVFANNFAFGPVLDYHLTQMFSSLQEGARIISSKAFCSRSKRLSDRQLNGKWFPCVPCMHCY